MAKRKIIRDKNGIVYPVTSKEAVIGLVEDINKLNDSIKALLGVDITYFLGREEAMSLFEQKKDNFEFTDSDDIKWDTSDESKPKAMLQNNVTNKITRALLKPEATSTYNRVPYIEANTIEPSFNISTANPSPSTIILRDTNGGCQIKAATVTEVDNNTSPNYVVNNTLLKDYVSFKAFTKPSDTVTYTRIPSVSANTTEQNFYRLEMAQTAFTIPLRNANGQLQVNSTTITEVDNAANNALVINNALLRGYVAAKTTPINDSITSLNDRFITLDGNLTSLTIGNYLVMRTFDIIGNDVITYEDDRGTLNHVNIEGDYLKEMTSMTIIDEDWGGIYLINSQGLNKIVNGNVRNIKYTNPGDSRTILIKIS